MPDNKRILGNVALPDYSRLVYWLDSEEENGGIKIENKNDHRYFSVRIDSETIVINSEGDLSLPIDRQTITVNSEGKLVAAGLTVSEGEAIRIEMEVVEGVSQATINVRYDSETIILDSENRLTVPIDHETIIINSEGQLVAIPEPLYDGVATHVHFGTTGWDSEAIDVLYDSETLRVDSKNRLFVPIDKEMIIVNSEDLISLKIDNKTIIFENSEIQTRIGGWREDPVNREFFDVTVPVLPTDGVVRIEDYDIKPEVGTVIEVTASIDLGGSPVSETVQFTLDNSADHEWLEAFTPGNQVIDGVRFKKDYSEIQLIIDPAKAAIGSDFTARGHGDTYIYHKANGIYLPTDNKTIYTIDDSEHSLKVIYRVDEERGLEVDDSEERIFVKVDGVSIGFDSEGRLTGTKKLEAILPVYITSEGDSEGEQKVKLLYADALDVNSEGKLFTKVDNLTIKLNSEGELASALEAGEAIEIIESEGVPVVNVLYDDITIHLNSENHLELHPDEERAFAVDSEGKLFVKIDELTIQYNSEGKLVAFPEPLHDGIATHIVFGTSEWDSEAINVLFNEDRGLLVNSENELEVKADEIHIFFSSEGKLELHLNEMKALEVDSEALLAVKVDDLSVHFNSEGQLEVKVDEDRALEITSEGKVAVKVDDLSVKFDSEGRLYAIPEPLFDGVATRVNPKTSAYDSESIDVLFNSEAGLRVNDENELEVVLDSEALAFKDGAIQILFDHETLVLDSEAALSVPIDRATVIIDSEGKITVNIDNETIVYEADSEGIEKVRVNIDNETIRFNSEGQLSADALPKPYIEDTFLHINSETLEPEWVEAKINGVSLNGDHNTEETRIIWWGTSEEYAALEAAGELYDYTLYVVNDGAPIAPEDKDYNELINKPAINGVTLSGNKTLADFGIQSTLSNGVATILANNQISLQYLAGVLGVDTSNRLYADTYTTAQIDNMLASLRTVRYSATKPTNPARNTLYYVGTTSPYQIYLYDSYGTEINLGTSAVQTYSAGQGITIDSANIISANVDTVINEGTASSNPPTSQAVAAYAEHKTNKVTAISATSTNEQYPSAKLVYDELQNKVGQVAPSDSSLQILGGTTITHIEPSQLGGAATIGSATVIPKITYDKFGHIQKTEEVPVYPPTTAGMAGQLWVSDGADAGEWLPLAEMIKVKYQIGSATASDSTTIVVSAPAPDAGYSRLACIGAYVSSNVPGVCWSVTQMSDAQVTIYANGWSGTQTITANTVWLYARTNS